MDKPEFDSDKTNLLRLVELTQDRIHKRSLIREQTAEMVKQQNEISLGERRIAAILDYFPAGVLVISNRVIIYANRLMSELLGYTKEELLGQSTRVLYEEEKDWFKIGKLQRRGGSEIDVLLPIKKKDGSQSNYKVRMNRVGPDLHGAGDSEFIITLYLDEDIKSSASVSGIKSPD